MAMGGGVLSRFSAAGAGYDLVFGRPAPAGDRHHSFDANPAGYGFRRASVTLLCRWIEADGEQTRSRKRRFASSLLARLLDRSKNMAMTLAPPKP